MPRHRGLLLIHIAASVSVLGVDLALLLLGIRGVSGLDARVVYPAAHLLAEWLLLPLATLSLASGVALALRAEMFRRGWVIAKFAITAAMTTAATFVLVPGLESAAAIVSSGDAPGRASAMRFTVVPAVAAALLALNLGLAVYKPTRRSRSSPASHDIT